LDVRARSGYTAASGVVAAEPVATNGSVSEPVREALTGLLPAASTAVELNAATFAIPGSRKATVVLTVGVNAFATQTPGGGEPTRGSPLQVVATAFDPGGVLKVPHSKRWSSPGHRRRPAATGVSMRCRESTSPQASTSFESP
jgi:hypothetical protein